MCVRGGGNLMLFTGTIKPQHRTEQWERVVRRRKNDNPSFPFSFFTAGLSSYIHITDDMLTVLYVTEEGRGWEREEESEGSGSMEERERES